MPFIAAAMPFTHAVVDVVFAVVRVEDAQIYSVVGTSVVLPSRRWFWHDRLITPASTLIWWLVTDAGSLAGLFLLARMVAESFLASPTGPVEFGLFGVDRLANVPPSLCG
jgi:hypothetical protein